MPPENTGRIQGGQVRKGRSGNPSGKPKGARPQTTLAIEKLLEGEAEEIGRKAVELAKSGDTIALRLCLERIAPVLSDDRGHCRRHIGWRRHGGQCKGASLRRRINQFGCPGGECQLWIR